MILNLISAAYISFLWAKTLPHAGRQLLSLLTLQEYNAHAPGTSLGYQSIELASISILYFIHTKLKYSGLNFQTYCVLSYIRVILKICQNWILAIEKNTTALDSKLYYE